MSDAKLIHAGEASIVELIRAARRRLFIVAPALARNVAAEVATKWGQLGTEDVTVVVDSEAEVYRQGWGDFEALKVLDATARALGTMVHRQKGIRLGLLVSDDQAISWMPNSALVEGAEECKGQLNAIHLPRVTDRILEQTGLGPRGVAARTIGMDRLTAHDLVAMEQDLARDPAPDFEHERLMRYYRGRVEFVELSLSGVEFKRKKITLPQKLVPYSVGPEIQQLLRTSMQLIPTTDEAVELSKQLSDECKNLRESFLIPVRKYGRVLVRSRRPEFMAGVELLRSRVEEFKERIGVHLEQVLAARMSDLLDAVLPRIQADPPPNFRGRFFTESPARIESAVRRELERSFPKANALVQGCELTCVIKDVTLKTLRDETFMEDLRKGGYSAELLAEGMAYDLGPLP